MLWNRSLVMYDAETNSHWSHIRGEAMQGEMLGTKLRMLPGEMTTWRAWLGEHPETTVLNMPRTHEEFTADFYRNPKEFVYGWAIGRRRYHSGMDALQREPVKNLDLAGQALVLAYEKAATSARLFSRKLGQRTLTFVAAAPGQMTDEETGSGWDVTRGRAISGPLAGEQLEPMVGMFSYREAWAEFFPRSQEVAR